jgi:ComF family protein
MLFPTRLERVRSGFVYDEPIRSAIQRFKYNGEYQRGYDLAARLSQHAERLLPVERIDTIAPVPLHPRRYRSRGFNQAEIIANQLGDHLGKPVLASLVRVRNTSPQVELSADERVQNLREAFAANDALLEHIEGSRVLLVDDVMTTGATIAAAAKALQDAGSGSLYGLTVARDR